MISVEEKLPEGSRARLSRLTFPRLPIPWSLCPGGIWHLLATHSYDPRAQQVLHLSPASLPTPAPQGKGALPPAQGKSQINLSDTTANVNSLPCLS